MPVPPIGSLDDIESLIGSFLFNFEFGAANLLAILCGLSGLGSIRLELFVPAINHKEIFNLAGDDLQEPIKLHSITVLPPQDLLQISE